MQQSCNSLFWDVGKKRRKAWQKLLKCNIKASIPSSDHTTSLKKKFNLYVLFYCISPGYHGHNVWSTRVKNKIQTHWFAKCGMCLENNQCGLTKEALLCKPQLQGFQLPSAGVPTKGAITSKEEIVGLSELKSTRNSSCNVR